MLKKIPVLFFLFLFFSLSLWASFDAEILLEQGMEAFQSQNYGSAELLFRKIIDLDPDDDNLMDKVRFYFSRSLFSQKKYKAAVFEFNNFHSKCKTVDLCLESRFWMAESYFFLADYVKAIEEYKRYISLVKKGELIPLTYDRIGSIYFLLKRYDEAIIEWQNALAKSQNKQEDLKRFYMIGRAYFEDGQYKEALNRLISILALKKNDFLEDQARVLVGRIYQLSDEHQKAIKIFNGIPQDRQRDPHLIEALFFKALSFLKLGEFKKVKSLLEIFVKEGQKSDFIFEAEYELAKIYLADQEKEQGLELLTHITKSSTQENDLVQAYILLAKFYLKSDPQQAVKYLENLLIFDKHPDYKTVVLLLVDVYLLVKQFKQAEKIVNDFVDKYPYYENNDEINFWKAKILLARGERLAALNIFNFIQTENPFSKYTEEVNYYLALIYYQQNDYKKSLVKVRKYLNSKDILQREEAELLLLNNYLELDDWFSLDKRLKRILKKGHFMEGFDSFILEYALKLYVNKKNKSKGKQYFDFLLKKFPSSESTLAVHLFLGQEYYQQKKYSQAVQHFKIYWQSNLKKGRGVVFYNLLAAEFFLKNYQEVINLIEGTKFPALSEEELKEIPLFLARSYFRLGKWDKVYKIFLDNIFYSRLEDYLLKDLLIFTKSAIFLQDINLAKEALKLLVSNKNLYAEALLVLGKYSLENQGPDEAIGFFSRIIIECPQSPLIEEAKLNLVNIYFIKDRYQDALDKLVEIKDKKFYLAKKALSILIFFKMGENKKAISLTRKYLNKIKSKDYREAILKANLEYYYKVKNLKNFDKYAAGLVKFKGYQKLIIFWRAKIYYEKNNYKKAVSLWQKLITFSNQYQAESLFRLGMINYYIYKRKRTALAYLTQLTLGDFSKNIFQAEAKLFLAIYCFSENKKEKAKEYLLDLMENSFQNEIKEKAKNLLEEYGY